MLPQSPRDARGEIFVSFALCLLIKYVAPQLHLLITPDRGNAALWLQTYEAVHDVDTWEELVVDVWQKFGRDKYHKSSRNSCTWS